MAHELIYLVSGRDKACTKRFIAYLSLTMATLEMATTFLAFTAPRSATALNYRLSSAGFPIFSRRVPVSVSVRAKPSLLYSPLVNSNRTRRFSSVSASASASSAPPQTEDSDVTTKIPPDNRIPATIITGFLGSGKVCFLTIQILLLV